eukprot:s7556_g1.t1
MVHCTLLKCLQPQLPNAGSKAMARRALLQGSGDEESPVSSASLGSWRLGKRRDLASIQAAAASPRRSRSKPGTGAEQKLPQLPAAQSARSSDDEDLFPHSRSLPVTSGRSQLGKAQAEDLELLTTKDLLQHLRRCGTENTEPRSVSHSTAASSGDEQKPTAGMRPQYRSMGPDITKGQEAGRTRGELVTGATQLRSQHRGSSPTDFRASEMSRLYVSAHCVTAAHQSNKGQRRGLDANGLMWVICKAVRL